jgi:hypothetical protein
LAQGTLTVRVRTHVAADTLSSCATYFNKKKIPTFFLSFSIWVPEENCLALKKKMRAVVVKRKLDATQVAFCFKADLCLGNFEWFGFVNALKSKGAVQRVALCLQPHDAVDDGYEHILGHVPRDPAAVWNFLQGASYDVQDFADMAEFMKRVNASDEAMVELYKWMHPKPSQVVDAWNAFKENAVRPTLTDVSEVPAVFANADLFMAANKPDKVVKFEMPIPDFLPQEIWQHSADMRIAGELPFVAAFLQREFPRELSVVWLFPDERSNPFFITSLLESIGYVVISREVDIKDVGRCAVYEAVSRNPRWVSLWIPDEHEEIDLAPHFWSRAYDVSDSTITFGVDACIASYFEHGAPQHLHTPLLEAYGIGKLPTVGAKEESDDEDQTQFPFLVPKNMPVSFTKEFLNAQYSDQTFLPE